MVLKSRRKDLLPACHKFEGPGKVESRDLLLVVACHKSSSFTTRTAQDRERLNLIVDSGCANSNWMKRKLGFKRFHR